MEITLNRIERHVCHACKKDKEVVLITFDHTTYYFCIHCFEKEILTAGLMQYLFVEGEMEDYQDYFKTWINIHNKKGTP